MNSEVDQFGRSTNNSDVLNDDKSKRILEALSDITVSYTHLTLPTNREV